MIFKDLLLKKLYFYKDMRKIAKFLKIKLVLLEGKATKYISFFYIMYKVICLNLCYY